MTTFPGSPKLVKGAIVGIDKRNPLASIIIFQYNPKTLTRNIVARIAETDGAREEALRFAGAPKEKISIDELEIDAADQLETGQPIATTMGIYPQLSALEMLLYPKIFDITAGTALLALGTMEVIPPEAPLTLFIWGVKRILPVRITGFTIKEHQYDPSLNPIRAEISGLEMQVLTYNDFPSGHFGASLFTVHQVAKEAMAVIGSVGNVAAAGSATVQASFSVGG